MRLLANQIRRTRLGALLSILLAAPLLAPLGGCSGGGGGGSAPGQSGSPGDEEDKPDGSGTFFVDPNQSGAASRIHIAEMFWGRLVDVHDIDAVTGDASPSPVFRDWVINENIQSDGTRYVVDTNPITQKTRLIIQRTKGAPDLGSGTFSSLLASASRNLPTIIPKNDDGSSSEPFSFVARNATLVVRFDDLLDDSDEVSLADKIRILTDYPPSTPFTARVTFDPNHGGIAIDKQFHSSRLLIDTTVSEAEAANSSLSLPVNSVGFPASLSTTGQPNISVRIPTKDDFDSGFFDVLRNVQGGPLDQNANGPIDGDSPTVDVVRAMRAGNSVDLNNGFLLDLNQPELLGSWALTVDNAAADPTGTSGFDFVIDLQFTTVCEGRPLIGDIVQVGTRFLEVTEPATQPQQGAVSGVRVRTLTDQAITNTNQLLGVGLFLSTYEVTSSVDSGCWLSFTPQPLDFPVGRVSPSLQVTVRFSEPMDPEAVLPFDTFLLVRGSSNQPPTARSIVVGSVTPSSNLKDFTYDPVLPLANAGQNDQYHVELIGGASGVTDLAGNPLSAALPFVDFTIDPAAPLESNGSVVLRFSSIDEIEPSLGYTDLRGQFFYDLERGRIRPRPVTARSVAADRSNPVPSIMIPFPPGIQTPLTPLGSKLQTVWRYCDLGWTVDDESNFNVDVTGLNWSPVIGNAVGDFYENFEIRLSHSNRQPDEALDPYLLPFFPASGLRNSPSFYTDNILIDPLDPTGSQKVVHARNLGYVVDPTTLFQSATGTILVPYPLNLNAQTPVTYTWRDTSITSVGADNGAGVPLTIETNPPLSLDPRNAGDVAASGMVPSFGLPLLMEYRCYPSTSGVGLNALDISLAINSSMRPNFRIFSTGGFDNSGQPVTKDPDNELVPSGGFNPSNGGMPTPEADVSFYIGQLDIVTRISRVHTIFIDTLLTAPNYYDPLLEPLPDDQPQGTSLVIEFRGATGFPVIAGDSPFNGSAIDPYGEPRDYSQAPPTRYLPDYLNGVATWSADIDAIDGAQFLQMRFTFFNNIQANTNAELSGVGIAFDN